MNRSDFTKAAHYEFVRLLQAANNNSGSVHPSQIFQDWLFITSSSLRQAVNMHSRRTFDIALEEDVIRYQKKYPNHGKLAEALGCVVNALEQNTYDFLGSVYMEMMQGNKNTGQFFTPSAISEVVAQMCFFKTTAHFHRKYSNDINDLSRKRLTISDPCVGGGSMLIAYIKLLKSIDAHPRQWWFEATDIDPFCAQMCYIQMSLLGAPGEVYIGNTLGKHAGKENPPWTTLLGAMYPYTKDQHDCSQIPDIEIDVEETVRVRLKRSPLKPIFVK